MRPEVIEKWAGLFDLAHSVPKPPLAPGPMNAVQGWPVRGIVRKL